MSQTLLVQREMPEIQITKTASKLFQKESLRADESYIQLYDISNS